MKPLKPFKISKIDMFAITRPNACRVVFISIYLLCGFIILLLSLIPPYEEIPSAFILLCVLGSALCIILPNLVITSKSVLALQPLTNMLLCSETLNRTNYLLSLIGPHFAKQRKVLCTNRICCLINLGEFKLAREEIGLFRNFFDLENDPATSSIMFLNAAILDLYENKIDSYSENIKKAYEYRDKAKGLSRVNIDNIINENYFITSFFTDDPGFEALVLNKIGKTKWSNNSSIFSGYSAIFYYYKRLGNKEKAVQYANMLLQLTNGNSELYDCRAAKEYLTNADTSN